MSHTYLAHITPISGCQGVSSAASRSLYARLGLPTPRGRLLETADTAVTNPNGSALEDVDDTRDSMSRVLVSLCVIYSGRAGERRTSGSIIGCGYLLTDETAPGVSVRLVDGVYTSLPQNLSEPFAGTRNLVLHLGQLGALPNQTSSIDHRPRFSIIAISQLRIVVLGMTVHIVVQCGRRLTAPLHGPFM